MPVKTLLLLPALAALALGNAFASTADAENFLKKSVSEVVEVAKKSSDSAALAAGVRPILLKTISFDAMTRRANGGRTVPQIFIGNQHVGGCDDLHALDHDGKLDPMLA